jgi:polyisoprenoid-binding protein YceI
VKSNLHGRDSQQADAPRSCALARCRDFEIAPSSSSTPPLQRGDLALGAPAATPPVRRAVGREEETVTTWQIDPVHSSVGFAVRHLLVSKVRGTFTRVSGRLQFDEAAPAEASLVACIDAASVDTHEPARDAHLRSGDFLDVATHPYITFRSTEVVPLDDEAWRDQRLLRESGRLRVSGLITLRGVTRPVVLDVEYGGRMRDPAGVERIGFSARTTIQRKAFGITFNQLLESGGLALGDKLEVQIEIEAMAGLGRAAKAHGERGHVVGGANVDGAAVSEHDLLRDVQPETEPA